MPSSGGHEAINDALDKVCEAMEISFNFNSRMWQLVQYLHDHTHVPLRWDQLDYVEDILKSMERNRDELQSIVNDLR